MNKVIIIGRLGADPETRHTNTGKAIVNLRVATTERFKDKETGEKREKTEWHQVTLFDRLAEVAAEYLRKGSQVMLSGSIHTRKYPDPGGGKDRYATSITAYELEMLGDSKRGGQDDGSESRPQQGEQRQAQRPASQDKAPQNKAPAQSSMDIGEPEFDDDIPF